MTTRFFPVVLAYAAFAAALPAAADIVICNVFNFDFSTNLPGQPIADPVIRVGDTVRWTWRGGLHNTVSAAGQAESWASPITSTVGFTFDHTFTVPGTYHYYCAVHGFDNGDGTAGGMSGTVTVLPPAVAFPVSVDSTPIGGVPIEASADNNGQSDGTTPFTRTYNQGTSVILHAPARTDRAAFCNWTVDGADAGAEHMLMFTVNAATSVVAQYALLGDLNGDDVVNNFDIDAFVLALVDPEGYALAFPGLDRVKRGDCNGDGALNNFDIDAFVDLLIGA
jgi:plastocyanin